MTLQQAKELIAWYNENKRDLPWRDTNDPYDVWLSEIMLQQTRIQAVWDKFLLFKKELPTIEALSQCEDDRLMRLWEGMGYYSRARNLKKCAIELVHSYNGILPKDKETLKKLPGIGPYTAGAISSIAYNQPCPAVDGNVMRVMARILNDDRDIRSEALKKEYEALLQELYTSNSKALLAYDPLAFSHLTQGLMELGEVRCIPNGTPQCITCPFSTTCEAKIENTTDRIPYRSSLKQRRIINRTLLIIQDGDRFLLHKRPTEGLLAGLYEFIGIDETLNKKQVIGETQNLGFQPVRISILPKSKHIFSHLEWHMTAYEIKVENMTDFQKDNYVLLTKKELQDFAIPSAFKTYVEYYALRDREL